MGIETKNGAHFRSDAPNLQHVKDTKNEPNLDVFPIDTEFVFENRYGVYRGDERALTNNDRALLQERRVHFPTDEQMVYDSGENLKQKLKRIINSYRLRG